MTSRADLISRLEAAMGPSRELDGDIAEALGLAPTVGEEVYRGLANGAARNCWFKNGHVIYDAPKFTDSFDAAITLVRGLWSMSKEDGPGWVRILPPNAKGDFIGQTYVEATHDNVIIALCIAALRAGEA